VQPAAPTAPAGQAVSALSWDDQVDQSLAELSTDVERLRADGADDLWNDSLSGQIERLTRDVDDLKARSSESNSSTPLQENQP
jgi:hypothetical protein